MNNSVIKEQLDNIRKIVVDYDLIFIYLRDRTIKIDREKDRELYIILIDQLQDLKKNDKVTLVKQDGKLVYINTAFTEYLPRSCSTENSTIDFVVLDSEGSTSYRNNREDFSNMVTADLLSSYILRIERINEKRIIEIKKFTKKIVLFLIAILIILVMTLFYIIQNNRYIDSKVRYSYSKEERKDFNSKKSRRLEDKSVDSKDLTEIDKSSSKKEDIEKELNRAENLIKTLEKEL